MSDDLVKRARLAQRDERMSTGALYGELAGRIEADAKRIAELEELLKEARTDLEHYVDNDWPEKERAAYPSCQRKYKRDMELCYRIDAALEGEK